MSIDPSLTGYRQAAWRAELLDGRDRLKRDLEEFSGGTYEQNVFATIRGGGSVDLAFVGEVDIDWGQDRIRLWYSPTPSVEWPMGVYLLTAPKEEHNDENNVLIYDVKIMDKLAVLDQDQVDGSYSLAEGTVVTGAVRNILASAGEVSMAVTDSLLTLPAQRVWEAGTSKLRIINDLLEQINYFSVWCDGLGQFRVEPYVAPESRPTRYTFEEGELSIHLPEWEREEDWFDTPNKVVQVTQGTDEEEALVGVAQNVDGNDGLPYRYSHEARGRWIVLTETGVEAADQATVDAIAQRRMLDVSSNVTNLSVTHAPLDLWPNELVSFRTSSYVGTATVSRYSMSMTPDTLCEATWREVSRSE